MGLANVLILAAAAKLLLIPAYYSTDFDVHRNWMAVTTHMPISAWYHDATSQWTLDYPPLFAAFEWALGGIASVVLEPAALAVTAEPYRSHRLTVFHRCSVVATDVLLVFAVAAAVRAILGAASTSRNNSERCSSTEASGAVTPSAARERRPATAEGGSITSATTAALAAVVLFNPALIMVDNVHFQYNGLLIAVLLLSIAALASVRGHAVRVAVYNCCVVKWCSYLDCIRTVLYWQPRSSLCCCA